MGAEEGENTTAAREMTGKHSNQYTPHPNTHTSELPPVLPRITPVGDLGRLPLYDCVFVCVWVHMQTMKVGGVYVWNWPEGTRAEGTGQREWRPCQAELPADLSAHTP